METSAPEQMSIFDYQESQTKEVAKNEKHKKLDKALDEIRQRFGGESVKRGIFLK